MSRDEGSVPSPLKVVERARELYRKSQSAEHVPEPMRTVAVQDLSIEITGDGGFELLFAREFREARPFALILDAWRRTGADTVVDCLKRAMALLPGDPDSVDRETRSRWIDELDDDSEFFRLGDEFRDEAVSSGLASLRDFIRANDDAFASLCA